MKKIKVGLLTMSDGRIYLHNEYEEMNFRYQRRIAEALERTGEFEVVQGNRVINSNEVAKEEQATVLEEVEEEKEVVDYNNDFTKFNEYSENKDNTEEIESLDSEDDSNTEVEEVLDLTETEDDEEIELL